MIFGPNFPMTILLFLSVLCTTYVLPLPIISQQVVAVWYQAEAPPFTRQLPPPDRLIALPLSELLSSLTEEVKTMTRDRLVLSLAARKAQKPFKYQDWVPPPRYV